MFRSFIFVFYIFCVSSTLLYSGSCWSVCLPNPGSGIQLSILGVSIQPHAMDASSLSPPTNCASVCLFDPSILYIFYAVLGSFADGSIGLMGWDSWEWVGCSRERYFVVSHTPYPTASFPVLVCRGVHQSKSVMLVLLIITKLPTSLTAVTVIQLLSHDRRWGEMECFFQ